MTTEPFPGDLAELTGLTGWPARDSALAPKFAVRWTHARRTVTIAYQAQDALWAVTEVDSRTSPPRTVSTSLHPRADRAYLAALDIIVSPLP